MKVIKISKKDADIFLAKDEGHFFDRKALGINGKTIQKISVAFANADGGEFIIGFKDKKDEPDISKQWDGGEDVESFNGLLQAIFDCTPTLSITNTAMFCDFYKGYVLHVSVDKSADVHKTTADKVFQRKGAQSLPLTDPQKILELSFAKGTSSFEDQVVEALDPEQLVDSSELISFLADYSPATDPLDFLINQHLLDNKTWSPTYASVLIFYSNPQAVLPRRCAVKITRYETREDDPEREHLADQVTIDGTLYNIIHNAVQEISNIMSKVKIWVLGEMKKVEYPPETIWEIVANAVIHRDYSISDDIQILIFDNRIEVKSPGKLPGYVNIENILDARYSRNPKIVRTLNRYKNPPNKDLGEGLNTAFQKMKEWKLKSPEIKEDNNYVNVIIPHSPLAKPEELILGYLRNNESIKNSEARELTGIKSENEVKRVFIRLSEVDQIERVPNLQGSASRWRLKKN